MRIWTLQDDPDGQARFADLVADGATRQQIADVFGIDKDTVTEWRKRPQIKARVAKIQDERAQRVLSHTDKAILARLEADDNIPTETLLRIRQTFAGTIIKTEGGESASAAAELLKAADADPELARRLRGLVPDAD